MRNRKFSMRYSHAIERTSTVPKSKNAEINIKKLEAVLKNKYVIIVAL